MIKLQNISHSYGKSDLLLQNINLRLKERETTALIGPSGCGKSTLARIIAGHLKPTEGKIFLDEKECTYRPNRDIFLIRRNDLFPGMRVLKQVMFFQRVKDRGRAKEILEAVRLVGVDRHFPGELSEGMKARLALARAIVVNPTVLILDEAFSSLDDDLRIELQRKLKAIWVEKTVLIITHQKDDLWLADRVVQLSKDKPSTLV